MLKHIKMDLSLFEPNVKDETEIIKQYVGLLEALVDINRKWLLQHPNAPLFAQSGVKESFFCSSERGDIGAVIRHGSGDLDSLAAWRIAELRQSNINATPLLVKEPREDAELSRWTLRVRLPNGTFDPVFDAVARRL